MRNRFHALCSYFAMFPETFAETWIDRLTKPKDIVLDPFCGRGTVPFQALLMGRRSVGCDTNPVAYCVTRAKTNSPPLASVLRRIAQLEREYREARVAVEVAQLPLFYRHAFHSETLPQIVYLRRTLDYRNTITDCMVTALVLGSLHGEMDRSTRFLSNQMPHTISTKPAYSVRFWKERQLKAPLRDAFDLLRAQARFRYASDRPPTTGLALHMDMRELPRQPLLRRSSIRCVVTSPPYFDVTNYTEDQWLRLWFLRGPPAPSRVGRSPDDRHSSIDQYWALLADMWRSLGLILDKNADIVIRLGARKIPPERLVSSLDGVARASRRRVRLIGYEVSNLVKRQTDSFRPGSTGCKVEVDCYFRMA